MPIVNTDAILIRISFLLLIENKYIRLKLERFYKIFPGYISLPWVKIHIFGFAIFLLPSNTIRGLACF